MPPSRHRPVSSSARPARRPRVAGLRQPSAPTERPGPVEDRPVEDRHSSSHLTVRPVTETPDMASPVTETRVESTVESTKPAEPTGPAEPTARRTAPLVAVLALALVAVLLGGLAAWFGVRARAAGAVNDNSALTDNAATSQVIGQVNNAVNTSFSYRYSDAAATQKAAQSVLVGRALCQYNNIFKLVLQDAPQQKLVLTTQVISSAVESLQGSLARVVIFADQQSTRTDTNQTSYAGAQFAVTARWINGQWKISEIDTYTTQAAANAHC